MPIFVLIILAVVVGVLIGTIMYARHSSMSGRLVFWLSIGAVPSALLGAIVNGFLPDTYALAPLAILVTVVGIRHLWNLVVPAISRPTMAVKLEERAGIALSVGVLIMAGAAVGFSSAITGTGGPVFLVPALITLRVPALSAIAVAQVVQLPLVISAVLGYAQQGTINYETGTLIGVLAGTGVVVGASIAVRLPRRALNLITGFALTGFGILLLVMSAWVIFTAG